MAADGQIKRALSWLAQRPYDVPLPSPFTLVQELADSIDPINHLQSIKQMTQLRFAFPVVASLLILPLLAVSSFDLANNEKPLGRPPGPGVPPGGAQT